jgi:uncharacterized SAM-binding protein YcdF (DUF218 family)
MSANIDHLAKILWDYHHISRDLKPADAIVALGSLDTRVAERAAELWHEHLAPRVVVAGGYGRLSAPGATEPEARAFVRVLALARVPEPKVLVDDKSTNSEENLRFAVALLRRNHIDPKRLILVTQPYMERRAFATVRKIFPKIDVQMASPEIGFDNYPNKAWPKDLMINNLVGDTQRIMVYPERGFTIPQPMPEEVEQAMYQLINLGYDQHLVK